VKTAFVIDHGNGGSYYYETGKGYNKEKIQELEAYVKTLPDKVFAKQDGMDAFSRKMDMDLFVSDLLVKYELKRAKDRAIVYNLRQISEDIQGSKIDNVTIPLTTSLNDEYPLGIKSGDYTKEQLADAVHFLADMIE